MLFVPAALILLGWIVKAFVVKQQWGVATYHCGGKLKVSQDHFLPCKAMLVFYVVVETMGDSQRVRILKKIDLAL